MKIRLVAICFLITSCSQSYYIPSPTGETAFVSFSRLTYEIPEITIIENCRSSTIDPDFIKNRKPTEKNSNELRIPANSEITFVYDYSWFGEEMSELYTSGNQYGPLIHQKKSKEFNSCTQSVSFIPEENKHYEVYFGKNIDTCTIKVSEVFINPSTGKKYLFKVSTVPKQHCQ